MNMLFYCKILVLRNRMELSKMKSQVKVCIKRSAWKLLILVMAISYCCLEKYKTNFGYGNMKN